MAISDKLGVSDKSWYSCKYEINVNLTFSDGTTRKLKQLQIVGLYIEKDYDNDHLPIMMIDLALSSLDRKKVDKDTKFHVRINQFYLKNNDDTQEKRSKKIYINDTFIRLDSDVIIDTNNKIEKKLRDSDKLSDDDLSVNDITTKTTYVLVKKSDLKLTKKITNAVLANINQETLIKYVLVKGGCSNKVLISNLVNKTTYNEFILQPKTVLEQLIYLEYEYGWYPEGAYIFIDYDTLYIIRKSGKPSAWRKNEVTSVCYCISDVTSKDTIASGIIMQDKTMYVNIGTDQYSKVDTVDIDDQINGSNVVLFNTSTGKTETITSGAGGLDGTGSYSTKMYHGHNSYLKKQFTLRKKENKHVWDITCTNGDISYFVPNKQFTFISDVSKINNKLKGTYRISSLKVNFAKNGNYFDTTSTIRVKRTDQ